jgi:hypothetical protein
MLGYGSRTRCQSPVYPRNHSPLTPAVALLCEGARWLALAVALVLAGAVNGQALIAEPPPVPIADTDDPGHFEVRSASVQLDSGVYLLTARVEYRLSSEARDALQAGVPLNIRLDVEVVHNRRLWFNNTVASLRQRFQLEYHALSERYIVMNVNSGQQESFGSLFAALSYLGRVDKLPLLDASLLEDDREYRLRLRAFLDQEKFPGPLRLLAFWRRDWSLASDWYTWPLRKD